MIPEALVLNFLDDLDAKMQAVAGEFEKSIREGKGPDELTGKVWGSRPAPVAEYEAVAGDAAPDFGHAQRGNEEVVFRLVRQPGGQ
jgi:hypothetical protein